MLFLIARPFARARMALLLLSYEVRTFFLVQIVAVSDDLGFFLNSP